MNIIEKYSPKNLNDFDLDKDYKETIKNFIKNDFLNVIIIGEHGTGKTLLLNNIVKEYFSNINKNNLHKNEIVKENNTNVFRINNLRDCGISFYRNEVKNFCQFPSKKKKLIVVDDLDMVDKSIQAIFKFYMEKWSHNFYFIATTTNPHKINESLLAKTYQLELPKKNTETIEGILNNICAKERMCITSDAKKYIAENCNGYVKILFMFLQKIYFLNKKITVDVIENNFTLISIKDFVDYFDACKNQDYNIAFKKLTLFLDKGYSICDIFDEMFRFIKNESNFDEEIKYKLIKLISKYTLILTTIHEENIELYFFTNSLIKFFIK